MTPEAPPELGAVLSDHPRIPIGRGPVLTSAGGIVVAIVLGIVAWCVYADEGLAWQIGGLFVPVLFVFAGAWGLAAQRKDAADQQHVTLREGGVVERTSSGVRAWPWSEVASLLIIAYGNEYLDVPGMVVTRLARAQDDYIEIRSKRLAGWDLDAIATVRRMTLEAHRASYRAALDAGTAMQIGDIVVSRGEVAQGTTRVPVAAIAAVREQPLDVELALRDGSVVKLEGNKRPNMHLVADLLRYAQVH